MMQNLYIALLLATALCVAVRVVEKGDLALLLCCAVVVANWAGNTVYVLLTGETDATAAFLATDTLSLVIVLAVSWKLAVGQMLASSYAGQIIMHILHLAGQADPYRYWEILTILGIGQILLLAFWAAIPLRRDAGHGSG